MSVMLGIHLMHCSTCTRKPHTYIYVYPTCRRAKSTLNCTCPWAYVLGMLHALFLEGQKFLRISCEPYTKLWKCGEGKKIDSPKGIIIAVISGTVLLSIVFPLSVCTGYAVQIGHHKYPCKIFTNYMYIYHVYCKFSLQISKFSYYISGTTCTRTMYNSLAMVCHFYCFEARTTSNTPVLNLHSLSDGSGIVV